MKTIHILGMGMSMLVATATSISQAATKDAVERQIRGLNDRLSAYENRLRINGFASLGATFSDEETAYNGIDNEVNFRRNTKAGVQMTFNLDTQSSVVTQMVSRGTNDFETKMEWAYFKHQFNPEFSAKLGRFRAPYYMLSEYLDIGYAVPWATMPQETYSLLDVFSDVEGVDVTWETEVGDMISQLQFVYGRVTGEDFVGEDLISVGYTLSGDTWSVRAGHSQANLGITSTDPTNTAVVSSARFNDDAVIAGTFDAIGFRWEPSNLLVMGEYTVGDAPGVIQDETSMYLSVGYRIGAWMPHLTYAAVETTDDEDRSRAKIAEEQGYGTEAALLAAAAGGDATALSMIATADGATASNNSNTERIGIGARWDYTSGVAIKFQYDMITVKDDTPGLFDANGFIDIAGGTFQPVDDQPDSTNIFSITIDTVF